MPVTDVAFPSFGHRLRVATRTALKILAVILALASLLIPTNGVSRLWYPAIMGLPLLWGALRQEEDRAFATWATYVLGFVVFTVVRVYADDFGPPARADYAIAVDRLVGFGVPLTLRLQHALYQYGRASVLDELCLATYLSYFIAPPLFALALWLRRKPAFRPYVIAIVVLMIASLAVHIVVPTAPPWLAALRGELPHVYRIIYDDIYRVSPAFYDYGHYVAGGNDVAAMPSLHTAAVTVMAAVLWERGGVWRAGGVGYALMMGFSLVYLGEHFVVDVVAGVVLAVACWWIANRLISREERRRYSAPAGHH